MISGLGHQAPDRATFSADPSEIGFGGDLACFTAFELLQSLNYLRKPGTLELERNETRRGPEAARLAMSAEGVEEASCGPLTGREAVLASIWWNRGRFRFEPSSIAGSAAALPLQDLLLEGVRLADEVEERHDVMPSRTAPLVVQSPKATEPLLDIRSVPQILELLTEQPGTSRLEIERLLPFAPVTLAFGVARLCEERALTWLQAPADIEPRGPALQIDGAPRARMLRVLVGFLPASADTALDALGRFRNLVGVDCAAAFFDPSSPSFARLRLSPSCFVSITALPVGRRHRFVLESLLSTLKFALLISPPNKTAALAEWLALIPPEVRTHCATGGVEGAEQLAAFIREAGCERP